jgi:hypothetical protein
MSHITTAQHAATCESRSVPKQTSAYAQVGADLMLRHAQLVAHEAHETGEGQPAIMVPARWRRLRRAMGRHAPMPCNHKAMDGRHGTSIRRGRGGGGGGACLSTSLNSRCQSCQQK